MSKGQIDQVGSLWVWQLDFDHRNYQLFSFEKLVDGLPKLRTYCVRSLSVAMLRIAVIDFGCEEIVCNRDKWLPKKCDWFEWAKEEYEEEHWTERCWGKASEPSGSHAGWWNLIDGGISCCENWVFSPLMQTVAFNASTGSSRDETLRAEMDVLRLECSNEWCRRAETAVAVVVLVVRRMFGVLYRQKTRNRPTFQRMQRNLQHNLGYI